MRVRRLVASCVWLIAQVAAPTAFAAKFFDEVGGDPLGSKGEWTNYIRLDDLDGDGDLDVIAPNCGGFFSKPLPQAFRVHRNEGNGTFVEAPEMFGGSFDAAIRVVDVGDVDGDGDLDVFAPSARGEPDRLFINDGSGSFSDEAATRIGSKSRSAGVRLFDADGDADLDLLVAAGYAAAEPVPARLYVNDGNGHFTEKPENIPATGPTDVDDIDAFDADRDGDLDLFLMSHGGKPALWMNVGNGMFQDESHRLGTDAPGLKYGPTACDVDGDGDLDLWLDNAGPGYTEALLINDGTGHFVDETASRVSGNPGADDNGVVCADVDLDGDFDAIVVSLSGVERVLINDGAGHFVNGDGFTAVSDSSLWLDVGDIDGDGRLDAVTGQGESGNFRNRVYRGGADNPEDTRAPEVFLPELPSVLMPGQPLSVRFRVADRVLVDAGPRVRAELRVSLDGTTPYSISAPFVGGDLFHATLFAGDGYETRVQACAEDQHGNVGCSEAKVLLGLDPSGSATGVTASSAGVGGAGAGGSGGGSSSDEVTSTDGAACGCRVLGSTGNDVEGGLAVVLAALVCAGQRRKAR